MKAIYHFSQTDRICLGLEDAIDAISEEILASAFALEQLQEMGCNSTAIKIKIDHLKKAYFNLTKIHRFWSNGPELLLN